MKTAGVKYNSKSHVGSENPFKKSAGAAFFSPVRNTLSSFTSSTFIQPKFKIGKPDDKYEQEADRAADAVLTMPDPLVQRQSTEEEEELQMQHLEEEEELQMKPLEEEEELQMKRREPAIQQKCKECEKEETLQMKSDKSGLGGWLQKVFNPPPKLKGNTSAPVPGNCGEFRWETNWELSKYGRGGFVIQKVNWREKLERYCDRPWTEESTKTYYEAWWITKNGKFPSDNDAVADTYGRKRPHEANKGTIEVDGTALYHDDVQESDLPADMVRFNKDTNAGSLRSSLNNPNLGGNISKPIPHYIKVEWDCCSKKSNRRVARRTRIVSRIPT